MSDSPIHMNPQGYATADDGPNNPTARTRLAVLFEFAGDEGDADRFDALSDHLFDTFNDDRSLLNMSVLPTPPAPAQLQPAAIVPDGEGGQVLACPACGSDRIGMWEDVGALRHVLRVADDGQIVIQAMIDRYDLEGGHDAYYECRACDTPVTLPPNTGITYE